MGGWVRHFSGMVNCLVPRNAYAASRGEMFNVYCMVGLNANIAADSRQGFFSFYMSIAVPAHIIHFIAYIFKPKNFK
jgi:hypothetical protein